MWVSFHTGEELFILCVLDHENAGGEVLFTSPAMLHP